MSAPFDGDSELVRVIYYSEVAPGLTRDDIRAILSRSRHKNARLNLTGVLAFSTRYFFQMLEGPRRTVNRTLATIMADRRHADMNIVLFEPIPARACATWSMAFFGGDALSRPLCRQLCGDETFRPDRMDAEATRALVAHLVSVGEGGAQAA